jgi:ubiquinone/menaquinone biosynthesis C-methylase UbiE
MFESGSYEINPESCGWDVEIERMHVQACLSWEQEARLLNWLGMKDGMSVLELGSGPGFITEKLLSLLPNSPITALDVNPEMHKKAQEYLGDKFSNRLSWVESSLMQMNLPPESYDFAIARLLFQHLNDPIEAAKQVLPILKPGGKLAIIDIDAALWGIVEPYIPEIQPIYAKYAQVQAKHGGNRFIGRRLWRILKLAGYNNLRLEAFVYHSDEMGIESFRAQMQPDRLLPAVQMNLISPLEMAITHQAYEKFLKSPDAYILMLGLIACGEKI